MLSYEEAHHYAELIRYSLIKFGHETSILQLSEELPLYIQLQHRVNPSESISLLFQFSLSILLVRYPNDFGFCS